MKASILSIAAAVIALTSNAYASEVVQSGEGYQANISAQSTRSRAEVQAETVAALRDGQILNGEAYPASFTSAAPGKTRAEVRAELAQAIKAGTLPHYE